ncbi:alpha/beta fold hydrolase [Nocardia nova]|uniref:thioesterase II family protein n=1 Tax=Nocardia nova TaxID=37330 RepID=UPI001C47B4DE|nr:alpha/beta fold hydrolase [Nocardia nova]MBV7708170.1 alpha/beta fold hydrolase [Nocardia nova]
MTCDSLRNFHPVDESEHSVVIFPHAGGAASYYYRLSGALSRFCPTYVVQYPGRHDRRRDVMPASIPELAAALYCDIVDQGLDHVSLFGHSMGATVAYEVASCWPSDSEFTLDNVFVSARVAPSIPVSIPAIRTREDAVAELERLGGTDIRILDDNDFLAAAMDVMRTDYDLMDMYQRNIARVSGHAIDVPIFALAPDDDARAPIDNMRRWSGHTRAGFDLQIFEGGHFYLNDRINQVVDYIRQCVLSATHA